MIGTVAENVLQYGTGGLNIDASRIGNAQNDKPSAGNRTATFGTQETISGEDGSGGYEANNSGRWPANVILDETTAELLDEQSGISKSLGHNRPHSTKWGYSVNGDNSNEYDYETGQTGYSDIGGGPGIS